MEEKERWTQELEKRITEIEQYSKVGHFTKKDYTVVAFTVLLCIVMVIVGIYL